jgi:hypothetical protein
MKSIFTLALSVFTFAHVSAADVQLIVQKVENGGVVPGNTYRLYAQMPSDDYSLHAVWGDTQHPLMIESTAPFYQHPLGQYSSNGIHQNIIDIAPEIAFDSFITLGYSDSEGNSLWDIGVDFSSFDEGGEILTNNGAWFLLPENEKCSPANGTNLVLLGQFTTHGVASGVLNLQGWSGDKQTWNALGVTFATSDAKVFGCMDATASNFNPSATYDDGSCTGQSNEVLLNTQELVAAQSWSVFPNPVRDNLVHIQFSKGFVVSPNAVLEIYDMAGKRLAQYVLSNGSWTASNRLTVNQQLAGGTYKIVINDGEKTESQTLIVAK